MTRGIATQVTSFMPEPARATRSVPVSDRIHGALFERLYSRSLVYNTCWEDPAIDRQALQPNRTDSMLVITSAGCNVLDYALTGARIHAVDANPRQTALLELKLAAIRRLDYGDFFALFGRGRHADFPALYHDALRADLSGFARDFWDDRQHWFAESAGQSFYFRGLSGRFAAGFRTYVDAVGGLRVAIDALLAARTLDEQRDIYDRRVAALLWSRPLRWLLARGFALSMLGVPRPQHAEVRRQHPDGVPGFVRDSIEHVFRNLPIASNYFWRVYLAGEYGIECCPEYLKPGNYFALKAGLAQRIVPHTCTVTEFLQATDERISKFVLLDHMDWMSHPAAAPALREEWQAILARARPGATIIFRSAHAEPAYLREVRVSVDGTRRRLHNLLRFDRQRARELQPHDRVQTYAGFHIAHVPG